MYQSYARTDYRDTRSDNYQGMNGYNTYNKRAGKDGRVKYNVNFIPMRFLILLSCELFYCGVQHFVLFHTMPIHI